jgi:GNAT superfamily N-acetyltransferase
LSENVIFRPPQPGDLGWIIHRHGAVIAKEFGWDTRFEATIAEILGGYGNHPGREQGWVAERSGTILGSVFLMPEDETTARLRVLYVEPQARGLGLGKQLVDRAIAFARAAGYRKIVLWTHSFQQAARSIYAAAGFRLTEQETTRSFGVDVVSETWEIELTPQSN